MVDYVHVNEQFYNIVFCFVIGNTINSANIFIVICHQICRKVRLKCKNIKAYALYVSLFRDKVAL